MLYVIMIYVVMYRVRASASHAGPGPALPKSYQAGVGRRWTAGFSLLPRSSTLNRLQDRRTLI